MPMRRLHLMWTACWVLLACGAAFGQPKQDDCIGDGVAAPEQVLAACDALLADKTTAEAKLPAILLARAEAFVRQERLKSAISRAEMFVNQGGDLQGPEAGGVRAEVVDAWDEFQKEFVDASVQMDA